MRRIALVLALTISTLGQTTQTRIPPDEAAQHLVTAPPPAYPSSAQRALIQGNVILRISIDESGAASPYGIISGHPLLIQAAVDAVKQWKYQPFQVDGKPAKVVTMVLVTFGKPAKSNAERDHAEIMFQHNFLVTEDAAQAALGKGDYADAEQQLNRERDLLALPENSQRSDRRKWMASMGQLRKAQHKYDEAEQYYKQALTLYEQNGKDSPQLAAILAGLGNLYVEQKQYELARDPVARSLAIYEKQFKEAGSSKPDAQQVYGRGVAYQSWMLSKLALQRNEREEAGKQCRIVLDFQTFISTSDRDSFVSACKETTNSVPKNGNP